MASRQHRRAARHSSDCLLERDEPGKATGSDFKGSGRLAAHVLRISRRKLLWSDPLDSLARLLPLHDWLEPSLKGTLSSFLTSQTLLAGEWQNAGSELLITVLDGSGSAPIIGSTTVVSHRPQHSLRSLVSSCGDDVFYPHSVSDAAT
eukprot:3938521-Rhodomonas_salina.3